MAVEQALEEATHEPALEAFETHVTSTMLRYAQAGTTRGKALDLLHKVTQRSERTMQNWFVNRTSMPDLEATGKIMAHWGISAEELFPPDMIAQLKGAANATVMQPETATPEPSFDLGDAPVLTLAGPNHPQAVAEAMKAYSGNPSKTVLMPYRGGDASGFVEHGELIGVDVEHEKITGMGWYLLRIEDDSGGYADFLRVVQPLTGRPFARVAPASQALSSMSEELELRGGLFVVKGINVLGRMTGRFSRVP